MIINDKYNNLFKNQDLTTSSPPITSFYETSGEIEGNPEQYELVKLPIHNIGIGLDSWSEKIPVKIQHSGNGSSDDKIDGNWDEQGDNNLENSGLEKLSDVQIVLSIVLVYSINRYPG